MSSQPPTHKYPSKRLVICCDGTWQVADRRPSTGLSNIAKLSRMIHRESEHGFPQVVYYQSGVGTSNWGVFEHIPSPLAALSAGVGVGLEDNVLTAYHYLSTNYRAADGEHAADEIFLFGFSRGAFTARALAGLVTELGLFRPEHLNEFRRAYELYRKVGILAAERGVGSIKFIDKVKALASLLKEEDCNFLYELHDDAKFSKEYLERRRKDDRFYDGKRIHDKMYEGVTIKVVGVWDTVGALGIPDNLLTWMFPQINKTFKFHDAALNSKIENAFQALALDEHRGAFKPTLWYLDDKFLEGGKCPNLKQCWFPGFHESIGGGDTAMEHWTKAYLPQTSEMQDVTLAWMCDQVDGLLRFDRHACKEILLREDGDRVNWASALETDMTWILQFFNLDIIGGSRYRTPGSYNLHNAQWKVKTNETMHPSVHYRIEATRHRFSRYFPKALDEHSTSWSPLAWSGYFLTAGGRYAEPRSPRWKWEERQDGNGARWVRPSVPRFWLQHATKELGIDEWVIREVEKEHPDRINFEANLLPPKLKDRLDRRNEQKIEAVREAGYTQRKEFWTRDTLKDDPYAVKQTEKTGEKTKKKTHAKVVHEEKGNVGEVHVQKEIAALNKKNKANGGYTDHAVSDLDHIMNGGAVQHA